MSSEGMAQKLILSRPTPEAAVPLIFDSPHSGRDYPEEFIPIAGTKALVGFEDRLVDELIQDAPLHGIALLAAGFPRAFIDPNRAPDDLDAAIVGERWSHGSLAPTVYSERGLGLVFRVGPEGDPIYGAPLGEAAVAARIAEYWQPYHQALETLLAQAQADWGRVWHINWHSMRPVGNALAPDPGATRPDFVIGDLGGTSAERGFVARIARELETLGYSIARNQPFAGGHITRLHGRPAAGRHSVQIEINRALYLDMATLEPIAEAQALRRDLATLSARLADFVQRRISES